MAASWIGLGRRQQAWFLGEAKRQGERLEVYLQSLIRSDHPWRRFCLGTWETSITEKGEARDLVGWDPCGKLPE